MAIQQIPGQNIAVQLQDGQVEPVWYGWFRLIKTLLTQTTSLLAQTAGYESAWTAYTPSVIGTGGATGTATGRYKRIGKTVFINLNILVTASGTQLSVALPAGISVVGGVTAYLVGREIAVIGHTFVGHTSGSTVSLIRYDNVSTMTLNWRIILNGTFETA